MIAMIQVIENTILQHLQQLSNYYKREDYKLRILTYFVITPVSSTWLHNY